jgi:hypothetical protein
MINSQDVYFGIKTQCAQVELKNINIFSKKIICSDLAEMEKHFHKKIYIITLCNFQHRSSSLPNTQHIQKLATEDLWVLRYCRSRFFHICIFHAKTKMN